MDETYRMLGREHELDLEREARKRGFAATVRNQRRGSKTRLAVELRKSAAHVWRRLAAFLGAEVRPPKEA